MSQPTTPLSPQHNQSDGGSVVSRLQGAGLGVERFFPVEYQNGQKKPARNGWQSTEHHWEEVGDNAGVVCGDGLVVVDLDHPDKVPEQFGDLPDTFCVSSMHSGEHLYFRVSGDQPRGTSRPPWGEVQSTDQMVVAPGTVFHHRECDDDCSFSGEGRYTILRDRPIATVDPADFPGVFGTDVGDTPTTEPVDTDFEADIDDRLTFAIREDDKFGNLWRWGMQGGSLSSHGLDYRAGDGGDDRSVAESVLLEKLLWWLEGDEAAARSVVDQLRPPKWSQRGDNYKSSIMSCAQDLLDKGDGYDPDQRGSASGVRWVWAIHVVNNLIGRDRVTTKEIAEQEKVEVGERQVRKVFVALEDAGYVHRFRIGNDRWWVVEEIPTPGNGFFDQFNDAEEIAEQRRNFLG